MILDNLLPLIKKTGSTLSPSDFHNIVNVVFHDIEAEQYDSIHWQMWESLSEQIGLLVNDIFEEIKDRKSLRLLDIGCGTGLSTELLLNTKLGSLISDITLIDTSANMLRHAERRAAAWAKNVNVFNSDVSSLKEKFDVIIICSVLHHIPDIGNFIDKINNLQDSGGIIIHLQDPNGDYMQDKEYLKRAKQYESDQEVRSAKRKLTHFIPKDIRKAINKIVGRKNYLDRVNEKLIEKRAIKSAMTDEEIWSITDIHVEKLPYSVGNGISVKFMNECLKAYSLVKMRSYGFYGFLKSELIGKFKSEEERLISMGELNGRYVSGVWIKQKDL